MLFQNLLALILGQWLLTSKTCVLLHDSNGMFSSNSLRKIILKNLL